MLEDRLHHFDDVVFSCFLPEDWLKEFRMPVHVLVYVYSGIMYVEFGKKEFSVKAGEYVFLKRDHQVRLYKTAYEGRPYKAINIRLEGDILRRYLSEHQSQVRMIRENRRLRDAAVKLPHIPETDELFHRLAPYTDKTKEPPDGLITQTVNQAVECLLRMDDRFYPTLFDFCEMWKINLSDFMEQNFTNDLLLKEFALYTGRSLATFKRDFAKFTDLSPEKWLVRRRLEAAYELLKNQHQSISDVCWAVGFRNRSHFTTAFKRQFGVAPSNLIAR